MKYKSENLEVYLKTISNQYKNYLPTDIMPYKVLNEQHPSRPLFDMWETSIANGEGWVGIVIQDQTDSDITIKGQYTTYIHQGEYSKLGQTYQQIMIDYPQASEFYNVYLNDPQITESQDCLTKIVFR
ncbi:MAG: hypothetical protein OXF85_01780 [Candidatus Saccharibacteria bacterium]|nr:hypothetical protein [Candidatus Saccharibacteria bacterium]